LAGELGVTDAWVPYVQGAFNVDAKPGSMPDVGSENVTRMIAGYRASGINTWFFERQVTTTYEPNL
jgi:hypothetical protein